MSKYNAIDIADYIVSYCNNKKRNISHLQLQKILYFIQANYLVRNTLLFNDEISKWKLGPVVEDVYHNYKTFGSGNITYVPLRFKVLPNGGFKLEKFNPAVVEICDQKQIEKIVDKYIDKNPFTLVNATHAHEPWKKDEQKILSGQQGLKYDTQELKDFFKKNSSAFEV